jgi:Mor family transcriptional regulator
MFSEYLEGSSVKLLSQKYKFSESEITDLINQIKRKMIENLKGSYSVRQ